MYAYITYTWYLVLFSEFWLLPSLILPCVVPCAEYLNVTGAVTAQKSFATSTRRTFITSSNTGRAFSRSCTRLDLHPTARSRWGLIPVSLGVTCETCEWVGVRLRRFVWGVGFCLSLLTCQSNARHFFPMASSVFRPSSVSFYPSPFRFHGRAAGLLIFHLFSTFEA